MTSRWLINARWAPFAAAPDFGQNLLPGDQIGESVGNLLRVGTRVTAASAVSCRRLTTSEGIMAC